MEKHSHNAGKMNARTRRHQGGLVSLCLIAVLILVLGTGLFGQRSDDAHPDSENSQFTNLSEAVAEVSYAQEEAACYEVASDAEYGEYEKGKVLVLVDETTGIDAVNAALAQIDIAKTKTVSDQDRSAGFIQVEIDDQASMGQALEAFNDAGLQAQPNYVYHPLEGEGSTTTETSLERDPAAIETASAVMPNDPGSSDQWALESLDIYKAWGIAKSKEDVSASPKVSVAVVDTGCLVAHEDLVGNIIPAAAYNSETKMVGIDNVQDSIGHGSHVAGIVSARANNGIGVAGTSYNAGLVIIKASKGETKDFDTLTLSEAYDWLLRTENGQAKTNAQLYNVRVVNMSVGGKGTLAKDHMLYQRIADAKDAGILTVCAAGNAMAGATPPYECIPGDCEDSLTVINLAHDEANGTSANDSSGSYMVYRYSSSNYNTADGENARAKNISAPGTGIYSTGYREDTPYRYDTGTSMASPAVAGVAALLFAYDPTLSATDVRSVLEQTATDLEEPGWDSTTGYGEADAYKALQVLSARIETQSIASGASLPVKLVAADGAELDPAEWTWSSSNPRVIAVDSDTGTITAKASGFANITATYKGISATLIAQNVNVTSIDLSSTEVEDISGVAYTGSPIEPKPRILFEGSLLYEGIDYQLEYENNVGVGVASMKIVPAENGRVIGAKTIEFMIEPADIATLQASIPDQIYTGDPVSPETIDIRDAQGNVLAVDQDFTVSYANNVDHGVGTAKALLTGIGNYQGVLEVPFTIVGTPLSPMKTTIENVRDFTYNGQVHAQNDLIVRFDGVTLTRGVDYDLYYRYKDSGVRVDPVEVGIYEVVIVGIGAYSGEIAREFPIYERSDGGANTPGGDTGGAIGPNTPPSTGGSTDTGASSGSSGDQSNSGSGSTGEGSSSVTDVPDASGATAVTAQQLPAASSVNGAWKKSKGKWWFRYDAASKQAQQSTLDYPASTWVTIKGKYYHFNGAGWMHTGWQYLDEKWYYFGSDGALKIGWQKIKGKWYYLASDGVMQTGKKIIGNDRYLLNGSGAMKTGWSLESLGWFYYKSSGAQAAGWQKVGRTWYYLDPATGIMQTGWLDVGGQRYFLKSSGAMRTGWVNIDNAWYHFNASGHMQRDRWVGNYYVGSDGRMATNTWIGKYHVNGSGKWDMTR